MKACSLFRYCISIYASLFSKYYKTHSHGNFFCKGSWAAHNRYGNWKKLVSVFWTEVTIFWLARRSWPAICLVFSPHSRYLLMPEWPSNIAAVLGCALLCAVRACVMILMVMAKPHQLFFEALSFRALSESWEGGNERPQGTADAKANLKRQCHRRTTRHWAADYRRQ